MRIVQPGSHSPARVCRLVLDAVPFRHMVYLLRQNACRILVETQATGETAAIEFDEGYDPALGAMGEYDTTCLRFTYAP